MKDLPKGTPIWFQKWHGGEFWHTKLMIKYVVWAVTAILVAIITRWVIG